MGWPTDPNESYFGRGLWGWATDVWERIKGDGSGALHVHIASQTGTQLIQQMMPTLLKPGIHGYDGSNWQELSLLWGYTDRLAENKTYTMLAGTTYAMAFTQPDVGYVHRITGFSLATTKAGAGALPYASFGGALSVINPAMVMAANVYQAISPFDLVLKRGDWFQLNWSAVAADDVLVGNIWGYKMKVA